MFHLYGDRPAPRQPIVTIFVKFSGVANVIKYAKFQNNR
jgi:hypothetical protein